MKKRDIEEEIQVIDNYVRNNEHIPSKLRTNILKQLEIVRKCAKPRRSNKGRNLNQNSGLLKPVPISEEFARFANWDVDELHSRVDVTKVICNYVKDRNLQKQSNKRTILPDTQLQEVLRWNAKDEEMTVFIEQASPGLAIITISQHPPSGLKVLSFYKNAEVRTTTGEDVAIVKNIDLLENGDYNLILTTDVTLTVGDNYIVHVPLTYPKVQTKISIHLKRPEL